jgi:L-arabinokinase
MGGIADYSGSLVMEMPIAERTTVKASRRTDGWWRVTSKAMAFSGYNTHAEFHSDQLATVEKAKQSLMNDPKNSWAAYVLGCVPFLLEKGASPLGADLTITSSVPIAKGLSSSASAEVATMTALGKLFHIRFGKAELPTLCQKVENLIVGAPCGLMDQLTCYLGRKNRLLPILCRPDQVSTPVPIPKGVRFIGVDSGVRHWVGGSSYKAVRTAAFMGYSLIAKKEGITGKTLQKAKDTQNVLTLPYGGYLAAITPATFEEKYEPYLPEKMTGRDFLRSFISIDPITQVNPSAAYKIRVCTQHPIYENNRVFIFKLHLSNLGKLIGLDRFGTLEQMGELMFQSHASYNACGLGEPVTDELVEAIRQAGPNAGVYGAKITGGGSGGTVCVLADGEEGFRTVQKIASRVLKTRKPFLTVGSSDGARFSK